MDLNLDLDLDLLTSSYDYHLPKSKIALTPANPPDSAKLLIYKRDEDRVIHTKFRDIVEFLPENLSIFFNDTKVIKARIFGKKETGGKIELLLNRALDGNRFEVLIRGRVKVGTKLYFNKDLKAEVMELLSDGLRVVKFYKKTKELDFISLVEILDDIGHIPLPPYIEREDSVEDEVNYQSIFAKNIGAVASPTASLHFTEELINSLKTKHSLHTITLHIGAGTFKSVDKNIITEFNIHSEYFHIPEESAKLLSSDTEILAVGTTVTRAIEYYVRNGRISGRCDLFLHPKNPPQRVNYLLTNFHLPKSTLIMLVSSFIGRKKTSLFIKRLLKIVIG